ncbi:uncharacterized protein [Physcomitrium patens]|uniref:uncharacterized protein n=1 Tax=Physcomitrium patens TaxID=3218 RepID=UPI003CCD786D
MLLEVTIGTASTTNTFKDPMGLSLPVGQERCSTLCRKVHFCGKTYGRQGVHCYGSCVRSGEFYHEAASSRIQRQSQSSAPLVTSVALLPACLSRLVCDAALPLTNWYLCPPWPDQARFPAPSPESLRPTTLIIIALAQGWSVSQRFRSLHMDSTPLMVDAAPLQGVQKAALKL